MCVVVVYVVVDVVEVGCLNMWNFVGGVLNLNLIGLGVCCFVEYEGVE